MSLFTRLEILEDRIAPAGLVDVDYNAATGELTIFGDLANNEVNIYAVGPNLHRIEGVGTDIETVGTSFMDIGKLKKVTLNGGDGADTFRLTLAPTGSLSGLTLNGGDGDDSFIVKNVLVKGSVDIHGEGGEDEVEIEGSLTSISGNLRIDTGSTGSDGILVTLAALKTRIGGMVDFSGGGADSILETTGLTFTARKGIKVTGGSADVSLEFYNVGLASIGKLSTGESILFTGGAGDDAIIFEGADVKLAGGIRMIGGAGDDGIDLFNPAGKVQIGKLKGGASILIDGGDDDDYIEMVALTQKLAGGIDFISGNGESGIAMGADGGTITIGKLSTGESIRFTGGSNDSTVFFISSSLTLAGGIDLSSTGGSTAILLNGTGGSSGKIKIGKLAGGQSIKLQGGDGNDLLAAAPASLTLAGGIEFDGGNGSNGISIGNPDTVLKIGKLKTGHSIFYTGGTAGDGILINSARTTLAGGIEFTDSGGSNGVEMFTLGALALGKLPSGQSVNIVGTGDASFDVDIGGKMGLKGSLEVSSGTGDTTVDLAGVVAIAKGKSGSAILLNGNDGRDQIILEGIILLGGGLKLVGGNEDDRLLVAADLLTINGKLEFDGGDGDNTVDIEAETLAASGDINITGGSGADSVAFEAVGFISGDMNIDLGGNTTGVQEISLVCDPQQPGLLSVIGSLTVESSSAAGFDDSLVITKVFVLDAVEITMGSGSSTVDIDNFATLDTFTLNTGDGDDVVRIERRDFFGGSLINKLATIMLGDGDDQLAIGSPSPAVIPPYPDHTFVSFSGGLIANGGGQANDNRNAIQSENEIKGTNEITGFGMMTII